MTQFSDLPYELIERIVAHLRPPGVPPGEPIRIQELQQLAAVRLVNRTFAGLLTTASLLHSLLLKHPDSDGQEAITAAADWVAEAGQMSHVGKLAIHQDFDQSFHYEPIRVLEASFIRQSTDVEALSFFSGAASPSVN